MTAIYQQSIVQACKHRLICWQLKSPCTLSMRLQAIVGIRGGCEEVAKPPLPYYQFASPLLSFGCPLPAKACQMLHWQVPNFDGR